MDDRSERNLQGVHPDLVKVIRRAHEMYTTDAETFIVTEGLRTKERQEQLFKAGHSMTRNSRHLTGHAVDLAIKLHGEITWATPAYKRLMLVVESAARELGIEIEAGGRWRTFQDYPHFQLPWSKYP